MRIHGKDAQVLLGEFDRTGDIISIAPELTAATHDTTTMGDDSFENIAGLIGWEATFEAFIDNAAGGIGLQLEGLGNTIAALTVAEESGLATGSELLSNTGFETAGAGGADVFANWTEAVTDGAIADEGVIVQAGSHAAKLTAGAGVSTSISQIAPVTPGLTYICDLYSRGDATYSGRLGIYDMTNTAYIFATKSVANITAAYVRYRLVFVAPALCVSARIELVCSSTNTGIAYFDTISCKLANNHAQVYGASILAKRTEPKPVADFLKISASLKGNGKSGINGVLLHPLAAETGTATGMIFDNAASSANGGRGNLHVTAVTGSWTVIIQHSSNGDTWATLLTFTQATAAGGPTSESVECTGTVNRYLRTQHTEDVAGSLTFAAAFARY